MLVLLTFAFLAGLVTFLSPCVLPVLPVILASTVQKSRSQPIAMVVGLIASFCFFTLSLTTIIRLTHIPANSLRYAAIAIVLIFGITLLVPVADRLLSRLLSGIQRMGSKVDSYSRTLRSNVLSGLVLGCALGLLWTPCAGPILATVVSLVATQEINAKAAMILFAYAIGSGLPMLAFAIWGQSILKSSRWMNRHLESVRRAFGALMILTAVLLATELDSKFLQIALKVIPPIAIDSSPLVVEKLSEVKKNKGLMKVAPSATADRSGLPQLAFAADFVGIKGWLNSPPLTIEALKGKVVLVDFWTYSCINCIRTFPYLIKWHDTYEKDGLVIVGIHTPEFEFEKDLSNVQRAIERFKIKYPVALDNNYATWNAYDNQYWPAHYLIDRAGIVREIHFGEGHYAETEKNIRALLGLEQFDIAPQELRTEDRIITPETYLGYLRAEAYVPNIQIVKDASKEYAGPKKPNADKVSLIGNFIVGDEKITVGALGGRLILNFQAAKVHLVMSGQSAQPVRVVLDGKPLTRAFYTDDMNEAGEIFVKEPRKYDVVDLKGDFGRHTLELNLPEGVSAYAFTFGDI